MPSSLDTPPHVFTPDRYLRLLVGSEGEPFTTVCRLCFLPSLYFRARRQGMWMARCEPCDARTFLTRSVHAWPLVGLGEHLRGGGVDKVHRRLLATLQEAEQRFEDLAWVDAQQDDGRIRLTLSERLACLPCGEPSSVRVSEDKKGRPYAVCSVCGARSFLRHDHSVRVLVGLSEWLRRTYRPDAPGESPWWQLHGLGKTRWASWSTQLSSQHESAVDATNNHTAEEAR